MAIPNNQQFKDFFQSITISKPKNVNGYEKISLNDSLKDFGSKRDRHANLGKGTIGLESFQALMQHPDVKDIPKYLETPNGEQLWKEEIHLLNQFANFSQTTLSNA